jgi:hypothetical protein
VLLTSWHGNPAWLPPPCRTPKQPPQIHDIILNQSNTPRHSPHPFFHDGSCSNPIIRSVSPVAIAATTSKATVILDRPLHFTQHVQYTLVLDKGGGSVTCPAAFTTDASTSCTIPSLTSATLYAMAVTVLDGSGLSSAPAPAPTTFTTAPRWDMGLWCEQWSAGCYGFVLCLLLSYVILATRAAR